MLVEVEVKIISVPSVAVYLSAVSLDLGKVRVESEVKIVRSKS